MKRVLFSLIVLPLVAFSSFAQTKDAYESDKASNNSLFDKSRLTVHHSVSFGMAGSSGGSNLQSQSLYTTMLQYQFLAPVTVKMNFGVPIHSTMASAQNLNAKNVQNLDYFKNMPLDFNLTWKPTENTQFKLSFVKSNYQSDYGYNYFDPRSPLYRMSEDD